MVTQYLLLVINHYSNHYNIFQNVNIIKEHTILAVIIYRIWFIIVESYENEDPVFIYKPFQTTK